MRSSDVQPNADTISGENVRGRAGLWGDGVVASTLDTPMRCVLYLLFFVPHNKLPQQWSILHGKC